MLQVNNEYGQLRTVLMASVETFHIHEPINHTQEYFYKHSPPNMDKMLEEQKNFVNVLTEFGVDILWAEKRNDCTNQLNTRDVAFAVGNTFVVCAMKKKERFNEHLALNQVIARFDTSDTVLRPSAGYIEGGDIVVDGKFIYVGIGQRTNMDGVIWLQEAFSDSYDIVPVYLTPQYLHLDCVFNLISKECALVQRSGVTDESYQELSRHYSIVLTDPNEQGALPTNVFSINKNTVVADRRNRITNRRIRALGKKVIELGFEEISKIGGSFRCSTCPLFRENE